MTPKDSRSQTENLEAIVREARQKKAQQMRMDVNLHARFGAELSSGEQVLPKKPDAVRKTRRPGNTRSLIYVIGVLALSVVLAFIIIAAALDITALSKKDHDVEVDIPVGVSTTQIATILKENDLINYPKLFRLVSKLKQYDGKYQSGTFTLSAKMGYEAIMEALTDSGSRQTLSVMVPEGSNARQIAAILEESGVCSAEAFLEALDYEDYDFDFLKDVPKKGEKSNRIYWLEGYLFPDTYEFYADSSGQAVVNTFLRGFDNKMDTTMRVAIKAAGLTMDDAVTLASILQGEAANTAHMYKVSRVLHNRMDNPRSYPRLECDSTLLYATKMGYEASSAIALAYDTYEVEGMPAGPINNPGIDAIKAAVHPSEAAALEGCYYFANDKNGNTYYSKTFAQHQSICRKYKIGAYA